MKRLNRKILNNVIHGSGTTLDICPAPRRPRGLKLVFYKPFVSSSEAIRSDWARVGKTLSDVIEREAVTHGEK